MWELRVTHSRRLLSLVSQWDTLVVSPPSQTQNHVITISLSTYSHLEILPLLLVIL